MARDISHGFRNIPRGKLKASPRIVIEEPGEKRPETQINPGYLRSYILLGTVLATCNSLTSGK